MLGRTFFILVAKTRITLTSTLISEIGLQLHTSYDQRYDTSALEDDTILLWLRHKVTE